MKKLIILVWGIAMSFSLDAQVVLEGEFSDGLPYLQVWDGEYLLFRNLGKTIAYHPETEQKQIIDSKDMAILKYRNGFYFLENENEKLELRNIQTPDSVWIREFDFVENWFGSVILTGFEVTGPGRGKYLCWISDTGELIAQHSLEFIASALKVDYDRYYSNDRIANSGIHSIYTEGKIALQNPKTRLWGYFDTQLNPITRQEFLEAEPYFEGMAAVKNEKGYWGFINEKGVLIIPCQYEFQPSRFSDGLAKVKSKSYKIGFIDNSGELKIPAIYDEASLFYKGFSFAKTYYSEKGWVLLDKNGVEEKYPGGTNSPLKNGYKAKDQLEYFPFQSLVDVIDQGKGIFVSGFSSKIFDVEGELLYENRNVILKDLKSDKVLYLERSPIGKKYQPKHGLIDINGEFLITIKTSEF